MDHLKEIVAKFIDDSVLPFKLNFEPYLIIEEEENHDGDVTYEAVHFDYNAKLSVTSDLLVTSATSIHKVYNNIIESIYTYSFHKAFYISC